MNTIREALERALELAQIVIHIMLAEHSGELTAAEAAEITTALIQDNE